MGLLTLCLSSFAFAAPFVRSFGADNDFFAGLNYLVKISDDGKLLWAKNNQPVDTTAGDWKDIPEGGGIVPQDMPDVATHDQQPSATGGITRTSSEVQQNSATHYAGGKTGKEGGPGWKRTLRRFTTLNGMVERLLRKTVRRNTWIYVSVRRFAPRTRAHPGDVGDDHQQLTLVPFCRIITVGVIYLQDPRLTQG